MNASAQSREAVRNCLPGRPAFFVAVPIRYFDSPMTGFVNRINTANQSVKSYCDTVECIKIKQSDVCWMAAKEESREVEREV